jgi:hypothetical protein
VEAEQSYQVNTRGRSMTFRTTSFQTDRGSVLHSGVYSRDLTASLCAGAVIVAIGLIAVYKGLSPTLPYFIGAAGVFGVLIYLMRRYVFFEEYLEVVFDKERKGINVLLNKFIRIRQQWSLDELNGIRKGVIVLVPQNMDGIKVVQQLSAHHGVPMPHLSQTKEFHTVNLEFKDGSTRLIFSTEDKLESMAVIGIIKNFVGGSIAQAH